VGGDATRGECPNAIEGWCPSNRQPRQRQRNL